MEITFYCKGGAKSYKITATKRNKYQGRMQTTRITFADMDTYHAALSAGHVQACETYGEGVIPTGHIREITE